MLILLSLLPLQTSTFPSEVPVALQVIQVILKVQIELFNFVFVCDLLMALLAVFELHLRIVAKFYRLFWHSTLSVGVLQVTFFLFSLSLFLAENCGPEVLVILLRNRLVFRVVSRQRHEVLEVPHFQGVVPKLADSTAHIC